MRLSALQQGPLPRSQRSADLHDLALSLPNQKIFLVCVDDQSNMTVTTKTNLLLEVAWAAVRFVVSAVWCSVCVVDVAGMPTYTSAHSPAHVTKWLVLPATSTSLHEH